MSASGPISASSAGVTSHDARRPIPPAGRSLRPGGGRPGREPMDDARSAASLCLLRALGPTAMKSFLGARVPTTASARYDPAAKAVFRGTPAVVVSGAKCVSTQRTPTAGASPTVAPGSALRRTDPDAAPTHGTCVKKQVPRSRLAWRRRLPTGGAQSERPYAARNATTLNGISSLKLDSDPLGSQMLGSSRFSRIVARPLRSGGCRRARSTARAETVRIPLDPGDRSGVIWALVPVDPGTSERSDG